MSQFLRWLLVGATAAVSKVTPASAAGPAVVPLERMEAQDPFAETGAERGGLHILASDEFWSDALDVEWQREQLKPVVLTFRERLAVERSWREFAGKRAGKSQKQITKELRREPGILHPELREKLGLG